MSKLIKSKTIGVIPGTPGKSSIPGINGIPGTPGYCVEKFNITNVCSPNPACSSVGANEIAIGTGYTISACSPAMICFNTSNVSSDCYPAVGGSPGISGTPGTSGTASQIKTYLNQGWNSHSRSIEEITPGKYLKYTVADGVQGVMISIGVHGKDNHGVNQFTQSILVDKVGITVFEDGVKIDTIKHSYEADSEIRLYRQPDNKVSCVVTTGTETIVHVFNNDASEYKTVPLYLYCHMYTADDTVTSAEHKTGEVHFGAA